MSTRTPLLTLLRRKVGLTPAGLTAVVAAVGVWVAAYVVAGTEMFMFAYGAALLVVFSLVVAPRRLKLTGTRSGLYPRAHEGDRIDVEVALTAGRRITAFQLEERVPGRLGTTVRVPISKLSGDETVTHSYRLRCTRRGVYTVGPLVAIASDPLGFAERSTVLAESFELLVHPRIDLVVDRPLTRQYEDPPVRPPVSKPWPSGFDFIGIREFRHGDDLRRMVWRATARTGQLMVREAEQGVTDRVMVVLDTDRGGHSPEEEGFSDSFETGVRAAASLAVRHLRDGYGVTLLANAGPLTRTVRGATSQLAVLDALARVELGRDPLHAALRRLAASRDRDAHFVVVTPRLSKPAVAQLRQLVSHDVSVLVVALLWDDESASVMSSAGALGCQVAAVHPGKDLASALSHDLGAGAASR